MHGPTDVKAGPITVVCASPNTVSVSRVTSQLVNAYLSENKKRIETFDVLDLPPIWVRKDMEETLPAEWVALRESVSRARALVVCGPVYYYDAGSPYNVLVEALGEGIAWKPVLLLTSAGSNRSHLAIGSLMQNLIFERHSLVFPDSVLVTKDDLVGQVMVSEEIKERLTNIVDRFIAFADATCHLHDSLEMS